MLANDPHLQLFNPPIWHMVQLDAGPQTRTTGVNFPGLPGVILGHNDFGAWGATVSVFDVTDIYVEQVTTPPDYPNSPRTVLFNGQQVEVLRVVEEFALPAGTVSAVIEVVPHHGPMVPDPNPDDDVEGLAATNMSFRWTGHEISLDSRFLTMLNQARNVEEFKAAVRHFAVGATELGVGRRERRHRLLPVRPGAAAAGRHGAVSAARRHRQRRVAAATMHGNTLWLPEEKFPQAVNPPQGFLATANNDQIGNTLDNDPLNDDDLPHLHRRPRLPRAAHPGSAVEPRRSAACRRQDLARGHVRLSVRHASASKRRAWCRSSPPPRKRGRSWSPPRCRTRSIGCATGARKRSTHRLDHALRRRSRRRARRLPRPRRRPISQEERDDAVATSIFAAWATRLSRGVFSDDFAGTGIGAPGGDFATKGLLHILEDIDSQDPGFVVHTKGTNGESTLWDDTTTTAVVETRDEIILRALADGLGFLADLFDSSQPQDWLWGKIHRAAFQHFFGQAGIQNFNIGNIPAPGSRFTVNPAGYSFNANSADDVRLLRRPVQALRRRSRPRRHPLGQHPARRQQRQSVHRSRDADGLRPRHAELQPHQPRQPLRRSHPRLDPRRDVRVSRQPRRRRRRYAGAHRIYAVALLHLEGAAPSAP